HSNPGCINIKSCHCIEISLEEIRINIRNDGWKGTCFKTYNTDIPQHDRPCTDIRADRPHGTVAEDMLSAALGKSRRKFCVSKTHEEDHNAADHKPEDCADHAA